MQALTEFRDGPKRRVPEMRNGYRFLRAAHDSVSGLFDAVQTVSMARRTANASMVGRMARDEEDLLRAAVVFTSSGLDASMTRLVRDVGRYLLTRDRANGARTQYELWMKGQLTADKVSEPMKAAVTSPDPTSALLDHYLRERTRASYQGSGDLTTRVRNLLGITKSRIPDADLQALDPFFQARNGIVHSMDLRNPDEANRPARIHRGADEVVALCDGVFLVAADLSHAAAEAMIAAR